MGRSLVPEDVRVRVAAEGAALEADGLCIRLGVLGQIRHCQVARLLSVCEAQCGVVQHLCSTPGGAVVLLALL